MNKKIKILIIVVAIVMALTGCTTSDGKSEKEVLKETNVIETEKVEAEISTDIEADLKVDVSELTSRDLELIKNLNDVEMRDFTLPDFDGVEHSLSDYKGEIIILNFWAIGCPPCVKELPDFSKVAEKDGVVLVTVAQKDILGNEKAASGDFIKDFNTVALWDEEVSTMNIYPSQYYPHTYIIDRQGKIRFVINSADYDLLDELVSFCDEKLN